jgi:hypothetical protein
MPSALEKIADIFGQMADGFGHAVADIRHKLVEEGWWGRAVTPEPTGPGVGDQIRTVAEDLGWTTHAERQRAGLTEPPLHREHEPDRDMGLDR